MMKSLVATAVVLCLAGCAPAPSPGDSPVVVITERPVLPVVTATEEPVEPEGLPDGAYLRLRATAHPTSGGSLDLVLTVFEPTAEEATPAATIAAISEECFYYEQEREDRAHELGIEYFYSTSQLEVTGDGVIGENGVIVVGLGSNGGAESGSAVRADVYDCRAHLGNAGTATLYNYFNAFAYDDPAVALQWQFVGFTGSNDPELPNVTFDNCSVEYGERALALLGGEYDWQLRDEWWRCEVAPFEYE